MKLQVAIDRVSLDQALVYTKELSSVVDMIEIGTSLIKDYGNQAIQDLSKAGQDVTILGDIKTIDEGAYEFNQGFKYGADILTVMGAASLATIETCFERTQAHQKTMMIDLLEVSSDKLNDLMGLNQKLIAESVFCLHHSVDRKDQVNARESVAKFHQNYPNVKRLAIAGGIDLETAKELKDQGLVEIVIVGSKIMHQENRIKAAQTFMEAIK